MKNSESSLDRQLKIRTAGRDASRSDQYRYPYEPTPYSVLERLSEHGYITAENTVLDYGSGKGRVGFYLAWKTGCHAVGVEYDERILAEAQENRAKAVSGRNVSFFCGNAAEYKVPRNADRCWFFNPFSAEILRSVLARLRQSLESNPRELLLFFYYPEDEYLTELNSRDDLTFVGDIDTRDLFPGNDPRERIVIYKAGE